MLILWERRKIENKKISIYTIKSRLTWFLMTFEYFLANLLRKKA